jgi:sugar lactone lactonase YvrE
MFAVVLLAVGLLVGVWAGAAQAQGPTKLPGDDFFPESISAAPNGTLYVSSLATGEIVRFAPGAAKSSPFIGPDVNAGTAGVMVDPLRGVLWACDVNLSEFTSQLRAFDLRTGEEVARYPFPAGGLCADIALAWGSVYVTDTGLGRIARLTTDRWWRSDGGTLDEDWSTDARFGGTAPTNLGINGIAFNGLRTLYTTNYSTGKLFAVRIGLDGSAEPVSAIALDPALVLPDGLRWHRGFLYLADNVLGLARINPRTGATAVLDPMLNQPTSLAFVGEDVWITEGQILRFVTGEPPILPFEVVRRPAP